MAGAVTLPDAAALVRFHTRHKLLLMAHSPAALSVLGRLVAKAGTQPVPALLEKYWPVFRNAVEQPASRGAHVNVLQHMAGYLRPVLDDDERREVTAAIDDFAGGTTSLSIPIALIRRHATAHQIHYLLDQVYLHESMPVESEA